MFASETFAFDEGPKLDWSPMLTPENKLKNALTGKNMKPNYDYSKPSFVDKIEGDFKIVSGKIKEETGKLVRELELVAKGKAEKNEGRVQKQIGEIKKVFGE
jgi:uncharacterized protein YjbJ (UPF0337 family)